jgi:hypothetical protein
VQQYRHANIREIAPFSAFFDVSFPDLYAPNPISDACLFILHESNFFFDASFLKNDSCVFILHACLSENDAWFLDFHACLLIFGLCPIQMEASAGDRNGRFSTKRPSQTGASAVGRNESNAF